MSENVEKPKQDQRWIKIALGVSLCINLLIAGLAIGTFSNVKKNGPPIRAGEASGAYTFALSREGRKSIGQALAKKSRDSGNRREQIVAEYQNMINVLIADDFDREAAQQILDRQFGYANERRVAGEALLLDQLEQMTLEERKEFADRLSEGAKRRPGPPTRPRN